jgi:glucans biosynthesis protein
MVGDHRRNTAGLRGSARCGAKTRRRSPCRAPSVVGKKRCRTHGGAGRACRQSKCSEERPLYARAIAERRAIRELLRQTKVTLERIEKS